MILFFTIGFLLLFFENKNLYFLVSGLILFLISLFFLKKKYWKIIAITFVILICILVKNLVQNFYLYENKEIANLNLKVISKNNNHLIAKDLFFNKYLLKTKENLNLYQNFQVSGVLEKIESNYSQYYLSENVKFQILNLKINEWKSYDLRYFFFNYLSQKHVYKNYVIPIIFGYSAEDKNDLFKNLNDIGVIHLVVISGFHFSLIYLSIAKITKKIDNSKIIAFSLIFIYFLFVKKSPSVYRSILMIFFGFVFEKFQKFKKWNNNYLKIYSAFLFVILINKYYVLKLGFWFSFVVVIFIYLINDFLKSFILSDIWKKVITFFLIWIISQILIIIFNKNNSLLSMLSLIIMAPVIEVLIISSLILMPFKFLLNYLYLGFEEIVNLISKVSVLAKIEFIYQSEILWTLLLFLIFIFGKKVKYC